MRKRYQVFISSTFEDLKQERQAAVEAILKAGHIPAGMELFTSGDQTQMDVIRRWIDESDIFMLVLGGRYGSIEPKSRKSYTELEYEYALSISKPLFAVVLTDSGREEKVKRFGTSVIETKNEAKYRSFRDKVTENLCAFYTQTIEVKLAILETLPHIASTRQLSGWISATDIQSPVDIANELARVSAENSKLRIELQRREAMSSPDNPSPPGFEELLELLRKKMVDVPAAFAEGENSVPTPLLTLALQFVDRLACGVTNAYGASDIDVFIYFKVASPLAVFGLVEHGKSPTTVSWQRLKLSKEGTKFFARAQLVASKGTPMIQESEKDTKIEESNFKAKTSKKPQGPPRKKKSG
jgi:hypothetical protein